MYVFKSLMIHPSIHVNYSCLVVIPVHCATKIKGETQIILQCILHLIHLQAYCYITKKHLYFAGWADKSMFFPIIGWSNCKRMQTSFKRYFSISLWVLGPGISVRNRVGGSRFRFELCFTIPLGVFFSLSSPTCVGRHVEDTIKFNKCHVICFFICKTIAH
jgi:hypothetical protein